MISKRWVWSIFSFQNGPHFYWIASVIKIGHGHFRMIMVPLTCEGRNRAEPRIWMSNFVLYMSPQDDLK